MLHPSDITGKTFEKGMGGYKQDAVDSFLELVAQDYKALIDEKEELQKKLEILADKIEEYRKDEDSLRSALIGAQKLGDSVIRESNEKAERILREAGKKAEFLMADAKNAISKEQTTLIQMKKEVSKFKNELFESYKEHIALISKLSDYELEEAKQEKLAENKEIAIKDKEPNTEEHTEDATTQFAISSNENDIKPQESDFENNSTPENSEVINPSEVEEIREDYSTKGKYEELKFGDNYDAFYDDAPKKSSSKGFLKRKNR